MKINIERPALGFTCPECGSHHQETVLEKQPDGSKTLITHCSDCHFTANRHDREIVKDIFYKPSMLSITVENFLKAFESTDEWLQDQSVWTLVDNDVYSVYNMSEREVKESILEDLLSVWDYEKSNPDNKLSFKLSDLIRHVTGKEMRDFIKEAVAYDLEISQLIEISPESIRIKNQREVLQAAMEYCGVWFDGFEPEDDSVKLIQASESLKNLANEQKEVREAVVKSMLFDVTTALTANVEGPSTFQ